MKKSNVKFSIAFAAVIFMIAPALFGQAGKPFLPQDHKHLDKPISYSLMKDFLGSLQGQGPIGVKVTTVGQSIEKRSLFLVHLFNKARKKSKTKETFKVFFYAQQHGNEPAGKDALLFLIHDILRKPKRLPPNVELWIMPMVNPDGAEADKRRNGNNADLNRDHILLKQPEPLALHKVYRQIMPHVAVDCHEFGRDSRSYRDNGWIKWPVIMMDCSNNPFFHPKTYEMGLRWIENAKPAMLKNGHNYTRYHLGGTPVEGELRHSTPEMDDGRNGLGAYQGLSFIIESGISRKARDPAADLVRRVSAYLELLKQFLHSPGLIKPTMKAVQTARSADLPPFVPINYFWATNGFKITRVKVLDKDTGKTLEIPTANFMKDLVVKQSVPTPAGYIIDPRAAGVYQKVLDRHAIAYRVLEKDQEFSVEGCKLVRLEKEFDEVYSRYDGRQIVKRDNPELKTFPAGSLWVDLKNNKDGIRAVLLLEPMRMYGLYEFPEFHLLVDRENKNQLPVWRVAI